MKQHNSFKNDLDMLSEAYGSIGHTMSIQSTGNADHAANALAHEDGYNSPEEAAEDHNKTGDLSDADLLKHATTDDGNLKPEARDALAKLYGGEDAEETVPHGAPAPVQVAPQIQ